MWFTMTIATPISAGRCVSSLDIGVEAYRPSRPRKQQESLFVKGFFLIDMRHFFLIRKFKVTQIVAGSRNNSSSLPALRPGNLSISS